MPQSEEVKNQIDALEGDINKLATKGFAPVEYNDKVRSQIALFVVKWYFYLIGIALILGPIYNQVAQPDVRIGIENMITVLSGIISGPFGFVVGYYFKGSENDPANG